MRELFEETGFTSEGELVDTGVSRIFTIDPRWRNRFPPGVTENLEHEFRYCIDAAMDIAHDDEEHSEWRWVSIEDAIDKVWSWTNRKALEELIRA